MIAAYTEETKLDMATGDDYRLRKEWRVCHVMDVDAALLHEQWGPDWRRYQPRATHVLMTRRIRDGVDERWTPFDSANSETDALCVIPDRAAAVDSRLVEIRAKRAAAKAEHEEAAKRKRIEAARQARRAQQQKDSEAAFERLATSRSEKNREWAARWNAFVRSASAETRERVKTDADLIARYQAVIDATTVPTKRAAIRAFLESF